MASPSGSEVLRIDPIRLEDGTFAPGYRIPDGGSVHFEQAPGYRHPASNIAKLAILESGALADCDVVVIAEPPDLLLPT